MKERIIEFLRVENKSSSQFAEEIGVQPSSISHIVSGRNNPSLDFVVKMLKKYSSLNPDWLLFGDGNMFRSDSESSVFSAQLPLNSEPGSPKTDLFNHLEPSREINLTGIDKSRDESSGVVRKDSNGRQTVKIAIFYSDNSFEEFRPS